MAKIHYISDNLLNNLIECTKPSYRDKTLFLDLDDYNFMIDVNMGLDKKLHCKMWGKTELFKLTDIQLKKIEVKVEHLLDDELEKIAESGESILN